MYSCLHNYLDKNASNLYGKSTIYVNGIVLFTIFLVDILECIEKIEEYTNDVSKEKFLEETWIQDAVLRRVEIIGEAVKNI